MASLDGMVGSVDGCWAVVKTKELDQPCMDMLTLDIHIPSEKVFR